MKTLTLLCYAILATLSNSTMMKTPGFQETINQCLVSQNTKNNFAGCLGFGTIERLRVIDSSPEFDIIDGLTVSKDINQELREGHYNFADLDSTNLRSIVETLDHVFGKRSMRWDMGFLFPGLEMKVSPSIPHSGELEFTMDSNYELLHPNRLKELGTGRLLAKQFLVPVLLGTKFKLATILPLIFGSIVLLAKKIGVISKIALVLSTAFGLSSLLFKGGHNSQEYYYDQNHNHHQYHALHPLTFDSNYKRYNEKYGPEDLSQFRNQASDLQSDELRIVYGSLPDTSIARSTESPIAKKGRNFAWEDNKIKTKAT